MTDTYPTYDLIVGLGRSGLSMAKFLAGRGRVVKATDIDPSRAKAAEALNDLGVETQIGFHDQATFDRARTIIPSPGVPLSMPCIQKAAAKGVGITGELDIFSRYNTTPVMAITGTNGKTTVTEMAGAMLKASGRSCFVGGNIGTPLVDYLASGAQLDAVVAEVSSFQLDLARQFAPNVGVLLNISEDHLDRYPDFKAYTDSKWSIFSRQALDHVAVLNQEIPGAQERTQRLQSRVLGFSGRPKARAAAHITDTGIEFALDSNEFTLDTAGLAHIPGRHNRENMAAAALAALCLGATAQGIEKALKGFAPLAHRIAPAGERGGIRFYNDSKATNVDAVVRALEAFDTPVVLILGGREKGCEFTRLIPAIGKNTPEKAPKVRQIIAIGEAGPHIEQALGHACPVRQCTSMAQAVSAAFNAAAPGDAVLLSPACASFDMYENYQERGRDFEACVKCLETGGANG